MTKFGQFIKGTFKFKNESLKNRDDFVIGFFRAAGAKDLSTFVSEDNSNFRKICAGSRKLSGALTDFFPKNPNLSKEKEFLEKTLNPMRIKEMFEEFGISEDITQNFNYLCEAIATQFENFMKYGELANSTVDSIYESIVDANLKGGKDANIDAIVSAMKLFYSCVQAAVDIKLERSLAEVRTPIETFLRNIYDVFNAFNIRCNHAGRTAYKRIRNDYFKKNENISSYLKMVSEPGSLPLELQNTVTVVIWGCGTKNPDLILDATFDYDMEYTPEALAYCLKSTVPDDAPEIPFSEYLNIHLKDDDKCLISDIKLLINETFVLLREIQKEFKSEEKCDDINKKITEIMLKINGVQLSLVTDCIYFPSKHLVRFAPTVDMFLDNGDGTIKATGDDRFDFEKMEQYYSDSFVNFMGKFAVMLITILSIKNEKLGKDSTPISKDEEAEIMTEIILLDVDKKARYYMFPPTCNAKSYRRIKEISEKITADKSLAFVFGQVLTANKTLQKELTGCEDSVEKEDYLVTIGYWNKKTYQIAIPMKWIKMSSICTGTDEFNICNKVWESFKLTEINENYLPMLAPLFQQIHEVENEGYTLDYMKE